ncbi:uncharacterized protein MELLADRAFT_54051 [Melampsora larici-populina 98AG31]|uniref:Uncharacterized protein n=1 Tax=Melampsora larici-populina (strain 98AG31 / pathotype 3-4-7) TaxID=747676 RepID=F4S856_MELLP|nr:uncharacterized protein MELLADRAFT_54051 [Melampsora larici-populina 98AG31]EGF99131.1 hypothetical protein MELLADRAFT_54051 [Melampsora larici-populina 98AG31]
MIKATAHSGTAISAFIAALPPNTNVYDALIPFLYKEASARNPRWILAHITLLLLSLCIVKTHIQRGSYWFIKRAKSGLLKPDRVLLDSIGCAVYAGLTIVDMSCQLYIDFNEIPIRGKLLLEWYRFPISGFTFWCAVWGIISNRLRAIWDPTHRTDHTATHCGMPKWVTNTLNGSFIFFGVSVLTGLPALYIPAYRAHNEILDIIDKAADELRMAASSSEAMNFSWKTLNPILDPLAKFPLLYHQLAKKFKQTHYALGALDFTLIITYVIFVFLAYKHSQAFQRSARSLEMAIDPARHMRKTYQQEMKSIVIEAAFLLVWLSSYVPVFIWFLTTSDAELLLSSTSVIVPELTLGLVASLAANIAMGCRLASSNRILACQVLPTKSTSISDDDGIKLSDRMDQVDTKSNASRTSYLTRVINEKTHSSAEKTSLAPSEAT